MDLNTLAGYGFFILTLFLVVMLYSYIYHLYNSEKKGERDYEKYGDIALNDEVTDKPVKTLSEENEAKEQK